MSKNLFFIGPASVGKSTVANLAAEQLGYTFIDVDQEFCERIGLIPDVVKSEGYPAYCEKNSELVGDLVRENPSNTVFATPSGFLVHEDLPHLVEKNLLITKSGTSVLLLPDTDPHAGVDTIVARQMIRWNDIDADTERRRFLSRFEKYKNYGDIKIFSSEQPNMICNMVLAKL